MKHRRGRAEGSIYQRTDGRWTGVVSVGYRHGKRIRRHVYGSTRRQVQEKLTRILRDQQSGIEPPPASQTVRSFFTEWLKTTAKPRLRPRTFIGYKQHVDAHVIPALGRLRLHALSPQQVQAMLSGLQLTPVACDDSWCSGRAESSPERCDEVGTGWAQRRGAGVWPPCAPTRVEGFLDGAGSDVPGSDPRSSGLRRSSTPPLQRVCDLVSCSACDGPMLI